MAKPKPLLEVKMAITRQGDRRKGVRGGRRKGDIEKIKNERERDRGREVTVHHEAVPPKKASSVWSQYEEFAAELGDSYITKKKRGKPKQKK